MMRLSVPLLFLPPPPYEPCPNQGFSLFGGHATGFCQGPWDDLVTGTIWIKLKLIQLVLSESLNLRHSQRKKNFMTKISLRYNKSHYSNLQPCMRVISAWFQKITCVASLHQSAPHIVLWNYEANAVCFLPALNMHERYILRSGCIGVNDFLLSHYHK